MRRFEAKAGAAYATPRKAGIAVAAGRPSRVERRLKEALQQQAATAEVLKAISRSNADLQNVLEILVVSVARLCNVESASIVRLAGREIQEVASYGYTPEFRDYVRKYPYEIGRGTVAGRALLERKVVQILDVLADPEYTMIEGQNLGGFRTVLGVPLLREGDPLGVIVLSRAAVLPFTDAQIAFVTTFADQAVIAIENARLFEALDARTHELEEALDHQTATSDVLSVISRSPTQVQPVLEAIVNTAARVCAAEYSYIARYEDGLLRYVAHVCVTDEHLKFLAEPISIDRGAIIGRVALGKTAIHVPDVLADPEFDRFDWQKVGKQRTVLGVPLLWDRELIGVIVLARTTVAPFTANQVQLVTTFADQAVIAIENARLFEAVQARTRELQEALDYQTATSEVLGVISRSAFDLKSVFEAIGESALRLCGAERAFIFRYDGEVLRAIVALNASSELATFVENHPIRPGRHTASARAALERRTVHIDDVAADPEFTYAARDIDPLHTTLSVPILRGDALLGVITIYKLVVEAFTPKQIALLETFADQAAIAIENARLFEDLRAALAEFHAVLDNIDYGVLFMDKDLRTRIVNPALRRLWDIPHELIDRRPTMRELLEYNRHRGVYTTPYEEWDEWAAERIARIRQGNIPPGEFARADGKVYTYQCVALPNGGRMLSYFDITELKNRQTELLNAKEAAEAALAELRTAQERLVQTEKLASLGQLTAGIAHEIKNPLNFVNNFASLSRDLLAELEAVLQAPVAALAAAERDEAEDVLRTVRDNLNKIVHHGKRADSIVRNMLLHARQGSGEWRAADVNAIAEEALNLAYHGARAGHPDFNIEIAKHLDPGAGAVDCCPQDIMRVILNLVSNGIYAANMKRASAPAGFVPRIDLTTHADGAGVAIEVRDNGTGIPAEIRDSIFVPFFTTKPAGEGTGLGLSLSHDIVVKQHGGSFTVESEPGAFTAFRVVLPRTVAADRRIEP